jgi:hypothetical protein
VSGPGHKGQRSLKVPRQNNTFLCTPPAGNAQALLRQNKSRNDNKSLPDWVRPLQILARTQALRAARDYTSTYAPQSILNAGAEPLNLVVGGHQPELFHPGVWFKNILLSKIAQSTSSRSLHVIIDHDLARSDAIRVPAQSTTTMDSYEHGIGYAKGELYQKAISLPIRPDSGNRLPWHLTLTDGTDLGRWEEAVGQMASALASCGVFGSIAQDRFLLLSECISKCKNLSDAFSQFRHRIELEHGVSNLEVPIGSICDASAFGRFVHHCVADASSLWSIYNRCRSEYRHRHSIRNQAQPVPELLKEDGMLELPFWVYQRDVASFTNRKRLWLVVDSSQSSDENQLVDHPDPAQRTIWLSLPKDPKQVDLAWSRWVDEGVCIRPRALMTTLFLRCFVADLFLHGIGGGAYDELTDAIILTWLGMEPPGYITCSASLHLGISGGGDTEVGNMQRAHRELQLMRSVPERFLDTTQSDQKQLFDDHAQLLSRIPERGKKRIWHAEIIRAKAQIDSAISEKKRNSIAQLQSLYRTLHRNKVRNSREFSFCLFREADILSRLIHLAGEAMDVSSS